MRRFLLLCVVAAIALTAGTASAQWHLGIRMVGSGNYFPYMPALSAGDPMPLMDAGLFGYKEFIVGYGDKIQGEATFAYDSLDSTLDMDGTDVESGMGWWYLGVAGHYRLMEGDGYDMTAGLRFQYGSAELTSDYGYVDSMPVTDMSYTGTTSQFSVPLRFNWYFADGKIGIGPEVAFKYTTGSTELEFTPEDARVSVTMDGPEYTGIDTEYSLNLVFLF